MNSINQKDINQDITKIVNKARKSFKEREYVKSYSLYKLIYRKYNETRVIPNLIDIAFYSSKKNLLKNENLKYNLIRNLIDYGLKADNKKTNLTNELIYLKLKLLREFKLYEEFKLLYENLNLLIKNIIFVEFEYLHFLLDVEKYDEAELILKKIKSSNKFNEYKLFPNFIGIENFYFDEQTIKKIINRENQNINCDIIKKENLANDYKYIIIVTGNHSIFFNEIIKFIVSLHSKSRNYLIALLIHDANNKEQTEILSEMQKLSIKNYLIYFEDSKKLNLNQLQKKSFYTCRRYLLAEDLLKKYLKPTFILDADTIICKNIEEFIIENNIFDMSLHIKESNRYFQTITSAGYSLFFPTKISMKFLKFYKKYIYSKLSEKSLHWHIDQIALFISYIMVKRFDKASVSSNIKNNYKNPSSYFYHTFHNKYLL